MGLQAENELHGRRRGRNVGLLLVLLAFVALVFGLSIVKIGQGDLMQAYDHRPRTTLLPRDPAAPAQSHAPVAAPGTPAAGQGVPSTPPVQTAP